MVRASRMRAVFGAGSWLLFGFGAATLGVFAALGRSDLAGGGADRLVEIGSIVGLWRLLRRTERLDEPAVPAFGTAEIACVWLGAVALALAGFGGYAGLGGIPAYRQDWAWPVDDADMHGLFTFLTADWRPEALGVPKPYPTFYTMFALIGLAGRVLHPQAVLVAFLLACNALATAACYGFVRRWLGTGPIPAGIVAVLYGAAPFWVDKTVGGHIHIDLAYALLPVLGIVALRARAQPLAVVVRWTVIGGAVVALAMSALTFAVFAGIELVALALAAARRREAVVFTVFALAFAVLAHVQSIAHLITIPTLDSGRSGYAWLAYLSASTLGTTGLFSYLPAYAHDAAPAWIVATFTLGVAPATLALLGLVAAFGPPRAVASALVGLAGIVGETGVGGPFGALKAPAYLHVHALAALREFYNFQSLEVFGTCGALAWLLARCLRALRSARFERRFGAGAVVAASVACVAFAAVPFAGGASSRMESTFRLDAAYRRLAERLSANDGERLAFFPLVQPIRPGDHPWAGTDPMALGFAGHATLAQWQPDPPIALAAYDVATGRLAEAQRLFDAMSVRWLVLRHGLHSAAPNYWFPGTFARGWFERSDGAALANEAGLRRIERGPSFDLVENPHAVGALALGTLPRPCADDPLLALEVARCSRAGGPAGPSTEVALHADPIAIDPGVGWTAMRAAYGLGAALAASPGFGIVTTGGAAWTTTLTLAAPATLLVECVSTGTLRFYLDGNAVAGSACRGNLDERFRWLRVDGVAAGPHRLVAASAGGTSAIARVVTVPSAEPEPERASSTFAWSTILPAAARGPLARGGAQLAYRRLDATRLSGTYALAASAELLFSDTYDARWFLLLDDGRRIDSQRIDGFENGFALPAGRHAFEVRFEPAFADALLGRLQSAIWVLGGVLLLAPTASALARRGRAHAQQTVAR